MPIAITDNSVETRVEVRVFAHDFDFYASDDYEERV